METRPQYQVPKEEHTRKEEKKESIEIPTQHKNLILTLLNKLQGIQNGEIKIIFRDGIDQRIDRSEWTLTRPTNKT